MEAKQFYETTKKMRSAQKMYFRTKNQFYLKESKELEKQIDNEILRVENMRNNSSNLF